MKTLLLTLSLLSFLSFGQNTNNIWYFGDGNFLDFNANMVNPVLSANGAEIATPTSTYCQEGSSTMCDAVGNLLFYNNSENVLDKNYNVMPNGTGLIGSASTSAQTIIVPKPGSTSLYYIFHMDFAAGTPNLGLFYSEVDMSLNGGLGDVTANKNIALGSGPCSEQLKAITHCNGQDIWLISHSVIGNTFYANLVSSTGVAPTISTSIGAAHPDAFSGMSYMTCTKDGSKVALAGEMGGFPSVEVFSFDNLNGTFCNPQYLITPDFVGSYGVEFSSDGTKLYTTAFQLHQYDFVTAAWYTFPPLEIGATLMRGPNDKIYIARGCDYYDAQAGVMYYARNLHVIESPNNVGALANLQLNAYTTPRECGLGLSTCYYPTQTINTCAPLNAQLSVVNTTICEGDCINFTNASSGAGIVSYDWSFPGGIPASFSGSTPPVVCYNTIGNYTASLQVTDCAGITSSTTVNIDVINCSGPTPDFQASQNQICSADCINFTDLSTGTNVNAWTWSFSGGSPTSSNLQNPQNICFATPGSYDVTLTVTDDLGTNTSTLTNFIVVDACIPPVADFSAPDTVCVGSCIDFLDQSTNSPTQWNWTLNGGIPNTSTAQNPQTICFNSVGTYSIELTVDNAFGSDNFSKDIVVLSVPNAGSDVGVSWCQTEADVNLEALLDLGVPLSGTWINVQNTSAFSGTTFSPSSAPPGTYSIQYVLENFFCTDTTEFTIEINGPPNAGIDGAVTLCDYDNNIDLMTILQGSPDLNGTWSPALSTGTSFLDPSIDLDGIYTYTVPQTFCGSDSSKATVTITYVFDVEILPVGSLCTSTPDINLSANIANGVWSGNGITNNALGTFNPTTSGSGNHTITYTVSVANCNATTTLDIIVDDVPFVDLGNDLANCVSEPLILSIESSSNDEVLWSNGSISDEVLIDFGSFSPGETVVVSVELSNACGTSSDDIFIELLDCDVYVYIPNSFTPDGNNHNQYFQPVITGEFLSDYELRIYNRWGESVFNSKTLNAVWDGTFKGDLCQDGVYIWTLTFNNNSGAKTQAIEYNGHVSIIR
ncbi:MAG: gliding motility-associated C-terminal domain-containing protein [Crocinitomicaceae bacterium]|nr:PKD domain-containing protein [Flavobacteriales bacterium]NQZ35764.1 gliding motility-associated C-terminal domain-containing protein [Crocinitomicaceae bacterium]